jgi:hypothetical protein
MAIQVDPLVVEIQVYRTLYISHGHVTHVAKPVTINKRKRDGILLRQMKISMVTIVKKTQPVLYPIYICMLLYDGRYMSPSGISVQWLNISYLSRLLIVTGFATWVT